MYVWNGGNSARDVCLAAKERYRCLSGITGTLLIHVCTYVHMSGSEGTLGDYNMSGMEGTKMMCVWFLYIY